MKTVKQLLHLATGRATCTLTAALTNAAEVNEIDQLIRNPLALTLLIIELLCKALRNCL